MIPSAHGPARVPLSILDLATVGTGATGREAITASLELAVLADRLGYRRIWFAEHHLAPGVASAAPAVLAALAVERTRRIRVGSGAVLLSTTSPVQAVEQFGTIAALHPGRVDLGVGRAFTPPPPDAAGAPDGAGVGRVGGAGELGATGAPQPVWPQAGASSEAHVVDGLHIPAAPPLGRDDSRLRQYFLAQQRVLAVGRNPAPLRTELEAILALRGGALVDEEGGTFVSPPARGADLELWVLASSAGESARVAGALGLPLAANYHVSPATTLATIAAYREAFRPGVLPAPYVSVSADVLVAPSDAEAHRLGAPFADWVLSIRRGESGAAEVRAPGSTRAWTEWDAADRDLVRDRIESRFVGSPETVVERLETLQRVAGADELVLTTATHDAADKLHSFELLAEHWPPGGHAAPDPAATSAASTTPATLHHATI